MEQAEKHPFAENVPPRPRYALADLMAEMPDALPMVENWDNMKAVGRERILSPADQVGANNAPQT